MRIVDASVVVKWFIDEIGSDDARRLLVAAPGLIAPALLKLETLHVIAKKIASGSADQSLFGEAARTLDDLIEFAPLDIELASEAAWVATVSCRTGEQNGDGRPFFASIYDCTYVALAARLAQPLVTADERQASIALAVGLQVELLGRTLKTP